MTISYPDLLDNIPFIKDPELQEIRANEYRLLADRTGLGDIEGLGGTYFGEYDDQVSELVKPQWLECLRRRAEGDWVDLDGTGTCRREGALAFLDFVGRCSRLRTLDLSNFDFGDIPGEGPVLLPVLLPSLPVLRKLDMSCVEESAQRLLLTRAPNLEELHITVGDNDVFEPSPLTSLPHLRTLGYSALDNSNLPLLFDHVAASRPALRELVIDLERWCIEQDVAVLIRVASRLEVLAVSRIPDRRQLRHSNTFPPPPAFLPALSTSTLTSICLFCHPTHPILNSLPSTLVSLETTWVPTYGDPPSLTLPETLHAVIERKKTPLHQQHWEKYILNDYKDVRYTEDGQELNGPVVAGLLEAATEVGLDIEIGLYKAEKEEEED